MKKTLLLLPVLALFLPACAEVGGAMPIAMSVLGSRISVDVPTAVPFPDSLVLKMDPNSAAVAAVGNSVLGALGQGSLEEKLGAVIKEQSVGLRTSAAAAFKDQLVKSRLFGQVLDQGGNVGISLGVSRYGLSWSPATQSYQMVLDVEAKLTEPHVGVIWSGTRAMKDLGADAKALATKVDVAKLVSSTQGFKDLTLSGIGSKP
jgi:hypothetical protein